MVAGVPRGAQNFGYVSTNYTICFSHVSFLALSLALIILLSQESEVSSTRQERADTDKGVGMKKEVREDVCDMSYLLKEGSDAPTMVRKYHSI